MRIFNKSLINNHAYSLIHINNVEFSINENILANLIHFRNIYKI